MLPRTPLTLKTQLRADEVAEILRLVNAATASPSDVFLLGPGGIGKTTLMGCLREQLGERVRARVDLGASRNRSALGVASSLLDHIDPALTGAYYDAASHARTEGSERLMRDALTRCQELLSGLAVAGDVFILDNIDRASASVRSWLLDDVLASLPSSVVAAGRATPPQAQAFETVDLLPFEHSRLDLLADFWSPHLPGVARAHLRSTLQYCSNGHPVKAELIAWAFSCLGNAGRRTDLARLLREAIATLPVADQDSLMAAVVAHQRLTPAILARLAPHGSPNVVQELPFSYEIDDAIGGHVVHPVALDAISVGLGVSRQKLDAARRSLAQEIYPRILSGGYSEEGNAALALERLRYIATLPNNKDFEAIENAFRARLLRGEIWRADEIAQIASEVLASGRKAFHARASLIVAENLIQRHDVADAYAQLGLMPNSSLADAPAALRIRVQYLRAKCITSPCALNGSEIFSAAGTLASLLEEASRTQSATHLAEDIRFELGHAYRFIARYEQALDCFMHLERNARDTAAKVRAVEEQAQLHRQMADLDAADQAQSRLAILRAEGGLKTSGYGLYCLGTLRRDQNDFETAERVYERALRQASEESDDYLACVIKGDWAWMQFLAGRNADSAHLLGQYQGLAELYGFSRELSECWHMRYHLEAEAGDWPTAYDHLDRALELANEFGNVIMQLDCMMHCVQRAIREERLAATQAIIDDMAKIEARGCGIRVFRGRALIYQGDGLLTAQRERDALLAWKEGFDLVANFGHSRSNVELLDGLMSSRNAKLLELFARYPDQRVQWPDACSPLARERIRAAMGPAIG